MSKHSHRSKRPVPPGKPEGRCPPQRTHSAGFERRSIQMEVSNCRCRLEPPPVQRQRDKTDEEVRNKFSRNAILWDARGVTWERRLHRPELSATTLCGAYFSSLLFLVLRAPSLLFCYPCSRFSLDVYEVGEVWRKLHRRKNGPAKSSRGVEEKGKR